MKENRCLLWAALISLIACGDLIADPSFDLWCGKRLCKPWEATGDITRVKTWHKNDYGVSLAKGAVLSQLSSHDPVDCIAFEVIADVSASADVWLEMDFLDDGSSEYAQLVPESHFAKLRYLVKAPTWYDKLRFILRKRGTGRAVLAQIRATESDECAGDPLPLLDRPLGATCDSTDQCNENICGQAPDMYSEGLAIDADGHHVLSCGECSDKMTCPAGTICSVSISDAGAYRSCIDTRSLATGQWCMQHDDCKSMLCAAVSALTHATCAECSSDDDCDPGQVCGVDNVGNGAARICMRPTMRILGELCVEDAECDSGSCNQGACSECNETHPCKGGATCGIADVEWLTVEASICAPGAGKRESGDACTSDEDCKSRQCEEPDPICHLCVGAGCKDMNSDDCGFLRRLAGTCL